MSCRNIVKAQYTQAAAELADIIANIKTQINIFLEPFQPIKMIRTYQGRAKQPGQDSRVVLPASPAACSRCM